MSTFRVSIALYVFLVLLFVGIFIPPVAMHFGWDAIARPLYFIYGFLCHQLPERSFFLFGPHVWYSAEQLQALGYSTEWVLSPAGRFVGDPVVGYKLAVCARDTGMYFGLLLGGGLALWLHDPIKQLGLKVKRGLIYATGWRLAAAFLLLAPLVADGGTQLIAYVIDYAHPFYMSNNLKRIITGLMFGIGIGIWVLSTLKFNERDEDET